MVAVLAGLEGTMPIIKSKKSNNNMKGTRPLTGPALPNLINAVRILKSKSKTNAVFASQR